MNKYHPCSIVLDRNQVKKIAEQNAIARAISGFPVFLCEMLQLLLLLLKFQLGWSSFCLTAVAHFFSPIVFISELQGPCLSMAPLWIELPPPSVFHFSPSSTDQPLCPDRQMMWKFSSCTTEPCLRSLLSGWRKHQKYFQFIQMLPSFALC